MSTETRPGAFRLAAGGFFALLAFLHGAASAVAQGTLSTEDGLSISFSDSGAIPSILLDGVEYARHSFPSGFAFRELPAAPQDVAPNGSLETGSATPASWSWTNNANGAWTWDSTVAAAGSRSLRVDVPGTTAKRSPMLTSSPFPIRPNTPYTFSCQVRTRGVSSELNVFLVEKDAAGNLLQRGLTSDSGTNDWEGRSLTFVSGAGAVSASFKVEIFSGYGTAWIDEVEMLDLFAGRSATPFGGTIAADGADLVQSASADGLELDARFSAVGAAIRVDATLSDTTGRDRAVELSFRLPLDLLGWSWDRSPVDSAPITDGVRFETLDSSFGAQSHSLYPFATVRNAAASLTLATPMVPQMNRFSYERQNGFRLTWDLGLSPAAAKTPSKASLTFWIYTQDPRWGLRAAAEKYRTLNSDAFLSAADPAAGAWAIPAGGSTLSSVAGFQDFGWAYIEGLSSLDFGNDNGISVLHYVDASGYFRDFPDYASQPQPPYDVLVAALQADATNGGSSPADTIPRSEMAKATINSSPHDPNGRYQVSANSYFWYGNRLQIYPVSPDPDIPAPSMWSLATQYSVDWRRRWAADRGSSIAGIFVDDATTTFATVPNYRRELWAYSDYPLTFSWQTGKVMLLDGFSMSEFCGAYRSYAHDRDLILMGSLNPGVYAWFAPHFDVLGGESAGAESFDRAYVRRVLGDGRPWSNLFVPGDRLAPDGAEVLAYLRQALLLGYFPGFNGAYWNDSRAYERDRALFRQYVPLIRRVAQAGWEPVTGAAASDPAVLLERFDTRFERVFYLTAQNTGTAARSAAITLDAATLGIADGTVTVTELLRGNSLAATRTAGYVRFTDTIPAGETFLYRVEATRSAAPRHPTRRVFTRR